MRLSSGRYRDRSDATEARSAASARALVEKISADVGRVLASRATRERWLPIGIEPRPTTPAAFDQLLSEETRVFTQIARGANIRAE